MAVVIPFSSPADATIDRLTELRHARHAAGQRPDPVAHRFRGDDDPGGRQPPDLIGRQAAPADADLGDGEPDRLFRRRPYQARRRGRVHAHRDPAARRRGRRERDAPRQACRPHGLGQRGERAGRRFPARPGLQDDGRGRLDAGAGHPLQRRGGDRRGRGDAAWRRQEHRHHRGRISRRDPRQDRRAVRGRLRGRPGADQPAEGRGRGLPLVRHEPRHRVPARRRRARLRRQVGQARQERRRRLPRGQDHLAGGAVVPPRLGKRARLLVAARWRRARSPTAIWRRRSA